jgi:hypothetical protein
MLVAMALVTQIEGTPSVRITGTPEAADPVSCAR